MSWAHTHEPWRALKCLWHFCWIVLYLPWSIYRRCNMQRAKLPYHILRQIPAPWGCSMRLRDTTTLGDSCTQMEDKINKVPAGEGFCQFALTKKATAFQQNEPHLPQTLAVPSLSSAVPFVNWPVNVAWPLNHTPLTCWSRSLPRSRNAEALNKEHFHQSRPRLET